MDPVPRSVRDGETGRREDGSAIDTGDVGIAASLAIGPDGTWHVAYADGLAETLRYVTMVEGRVSIPEVVDDGTGVDGQPFGDGKHVVGDDAVIKVEGDRVTIAYADSSSLGLRRARASGHSPKAWALTSFPQDGRWVAFPQFIPNDERTAAWWRRSSRDTGSVEGSALLFP